ncbi:hypothetical protein [Sporolactobacillus mangiferae]|nr:hypothetical protein [Sporolactobacillus mangiferae]
MSILLKRQIGIIIRSVFFARKQSPFFTNAAILDGKRYGIIF